MGKRTIGGELLDSELRKYVLEQMGDPYPV